MRLLLISIPRQYYYNIIIVYVYNNYIITRAIYKRQTGEMYVHHTLTRKHHIIMYRTTRTYIRTILSLSVRPDEYYCTAPQPSNYYTEISSFSNIIRADDDNNNNCHRDVFAAHSDVFFDNDRAGEHPQLYIPCPHDSA